MVEQDDDTYAEIKMQDTPRVDFKIERENKRKNVIMAVVVAVVIVVVGIGGTVLALYLFGGKSESGETTAVNETEEVKVGDTTLKRGTVTVSVGGTSIAYTAAYIVDGVEATITEGSFESTEQDENVFLVVNGGSLKISDGVKISKSGSGSEQGGDGQGGSGQGGDGQSGSDGGSGQGGNGGGGQSGGGGMGSGQNDNYSFYGTNSAVVVVGEGSTAEIDGASIETEASGANAVVATGGGKVEIKNGKIATTKDGSRGLHATYGGEITAENMNISTKGGSCATLATDRGEGKVTASNMVLSTEGAGSPLIYSTGEITLTDSEGTASGAQIAVVEGKNSATVKGSKLKASGVGNRNGVDNAGVMIYQSMSGDADTGTGSFTAEDSELTVEKSSVVYAEAPFFFVTNTQAEIELNNAVIKYGSGEWLVAEGTSEWGQSGSNGATVEVETKGQIIDGLIRADDLSSVKVKMDDGSERKGSVSGKVEVEGE